MRRSLVFAAVLAAGAATVLGEGPSRPAAYTVEQAASGRIEIQQNSFGACADCHGTTLAGRTGDAGELPPLTSLSADYQKLINGNGGRVPDLVGPQFRARWAQRTTKDLVNEFERRFAPPGSRLSQETRLNLIAYILQANGALPGPEPLGMTTDMAIGTLIPIGAPPESAR